MNTRRKQPFQPLEESEVNFPTILLPGGGYKPGAIPGSCGIFVGFSVNGFMAGVGMFPGGGPGFGNLTFMNPRRESSDRRPSD